MRARDRKNAILKRHYYKIASNSKQIRVNPLTDTRLRRTPERSPMSFKVNYWWAWEPLNLILNSDLHSDLIKKNHLVTISTFLFHFCMFITFEKKRINFILARRREPLFPDKPF